MKSPKPYLRLKAPEEKCAPADAKQRGELSELAFLHRASELGFVVSKPYGDNQPYDFIVDVGHKTRGGLFRIQVKSTAHMRASRYCVNASHRNSPNRKEAYGIADCDFLAIHVIPEDVWYIMPVAKIPRRAQIVLASRTSLRPGLNDQYREAWHLLARG